MVISQTVHISIKLMLQYIYITTLGPSLLVMLPFFDWSIMWIMNNIKHVDNAVSQSLTKNINAIIQEKR